MGKSSLPVRSLLQDQSTNSTVDEIDDVPKHAQQAELGGLRHGGAMCAQ